MTKFHRARLGAALSAAALSLSGLTATTALAGPATAAATPYTVSSLHFAVHAGPGGARSCDIVGDLYLPTTATPAKRVPAVLTTNGFGGPAADQTPFAQK